jgi:hypothetical protein
LRSTHMMGEGKGQNPPFKAWNGDSEDSTKYEKA